MTSTSLDRRLTLASLILAASVLASRLLGFVRDAVIAYLFGAGGQTDVYFAAFTLPDMMNYFLAGGALSITFIPLYSRYISDGQRRAADDLIGVVATIVGLATVVLIGLGEIWADQLVTPLFPGFSDSQHAETAFMTRIVLPGQVFFLLGGILSAVLMVHERFLPVALVPVIYNLAIIVVGVALSPFMGVAGFSVGALVGAVLAPFVVPLWFARHLFRFRPRFAPRDRDLIRYIKISLPLMVGVTLLTADEWIGRYFGASLAPGTISWLQNARRIMLVPMALIGQAAAQAALPYLSRLVAEDKPQQVGRTLSGTLRAALFLSILAAVALAVMHRPVIGALFERGKFSSYDTAQTARILLFYSPAVAAWAVQTVAVRGFYAHSDTWRPMILGSVITVAALPVYAGLSEAMAGPGLALATSIGLWAFALGTLALYQRVRGGLDLGGLVQTFARGLIVAAPAALAAFGALAGIDAVASAGALSWWLQLLTGSAVYGVVVVLVTRRLGGVEGKSLERIICRLRRAGPR